MKYTLYIGGYSEKGISRAIMHDGKLSLVESFPALNASYLCLSPDGRHLYAVSETARDGHVMSFDIAADGKLTQTAIQPTHGADPCHLLLVGDLLIVTNYTSGSVARFPVLEDGRLGEMLPLIRHEGASGRKPDRQEAAHPHQTQLTPSGYLAVADLGTDAIHFYPTPEITAEQPAALKMNVLAGFGPRHCLFPSGSDVWYVLCELESQLLIYRGAPGKATLVGRVPIGSGHGENYPAALRMSPDRKMLAATGRGENIVTLFSVGENGMPARLTEVSSRGNWPRDVQFSPDGKYLVCANHLGNSLAAFAVENGHLEYRSSLRLPGPSCVLFTNLQTEE